MKRFILFIGSDYYPRGGVGDYVNSFTTFENAKNGAPNANGDWYEIVYIEDDGTLKSIEEGRVHTEYNYDTDTRDVKLIP